MTVENTIFEHDAAFDELGELFNYLVENVEKGFNYYSTVYEDRGYYIILTYIDIILALCKQYDTLPEITSVKVDKWKQDFLNTFGQRLDERQYEQDHIQKQKEIITATFGRLYKLLVDYERDSFS